MKVKEFLDSTKDEILISVNYNEEYIRNTDKEFEKYKNYEISDFMSYNDLDENYRMKTFTVLVVNDKEILRNKRYLDIAKQFSTWSKDPSTKVGAVIVGDKDQIVSQGYNGFPRGFNDSQERLHNRETKYKYVIHAEANALYNALYNGAKVDGCTIYVHGLPVCSECAKALIQSGIKKVVYDTEPKEQWKEQTQLALDMFKEANIEVVKIENDR